MKKYLIILTLFSSFAFAQNISDYKYALVPSKFLFLKETDQYRLNTLLKLFMQKQGFETYFDKDANAPDDFVNSNCNKIMLDLINNSSAFVTKLKVVIKDCKGVVLYTSEEGSSREKEYEVGYNQALRMAFQSMGGIRSKAADVVHSTIIIDDVNATDKNELASPSPTGVLTVKKTANGYEIFDSNSKLVFSLFNTSVKEIFMAKKDTVQGIVYKAEDHWFFEHYRGNKLLTEVIAVTLK
ncbi:hypothetical protein OX284_009760 [Flavobacterium sp. SUN046]|uniref:hypothetical protein n=1 Tax=Flavobacterium sp. SUN046 TaxID=3002440 RepID=UPI002DBD55B6|nr:hypothetical protein [Flavobacterium sp. SUN046]MEC4049711.1 hypothetical protein [Flavobacterium sp. SUN046]